MFTNIMIYKQIIIPQSSHLIVVHCYKAVVKYNCVFCATSLAAFYPKYCVNIEQGKQEEMIHDIHFSHLCTTLCPHTIFKKKRLKKKE